jgi:hypothetical protein
VGFHERGCGPISPTSYERIYASACLDVLVPRLDHEPLALAAGFDLRSWAARPRPLRPCSRVLTLKYPIAAGIVRPSRR